MIGLGGMEWDGNGMGWDGGSGAGWRVDALLRLTHPTLDWMLDWMSDWMLDFTLGFFGILGWLR